MLIKSKSRKDIRAFGQLLRYVLQKEKEGPNPEVLLTQNLRGKDIPTWVKEFTQNEQKRLSKRRNSVRIFHEIMSFAPEDSPHLSPSTVEDLVQEYLERRAPQALALAVIHQDTEHLHVHLLISGVTYQSGKSTSISKATFARIKKEIEEIQRERYPMLVYSLAQGNVKKKAA